ncbi:MAG: response regulator transcription factor [Planctomycetaceae bacterium]|nr:response regulator transcription factor [Planctomycetaceae bacterium]
MKPTVFLVDDDPKFLRSTTRLLESEEFPVSTFSSGQEFFANYKPGSPGCLLLDLMMPEMSGIDVLQRMRALNWSLPTIVMTAFGSVMSAVKAMKLGALDFVEKPIHRNADLKQLLRRTLKIRQPSQEAQREIQQTGEQLRTLTDREVKVLNRVVDGLSSREIASEFGVSLATVNSQRASIMEKLEVNSSQSLIGLVSRYQYARQLRSASGLTTKTRRG